MKATKYMCQGKDLSYDDRLRRLKLPTFNYRTIELYKIITGKYDSNCSLQLYLCSELVHASVTRRNYYKLVPQHCKYDLQKHYFTNRLVPVWNSLANNVVMADNINIFKNCLDKF